MTMLQNRSVEMPSSKPRRFIDEERFDLSPSDRFDIDGAKAGIHRGVEKFREAMLPGLHMRTQESYAAVIESATAFMEAKITLLKLAARHQNNDELEAVLIHAARRSADMEERAVRVERIKRPGKSAQYEHVSTVQK